MVERGPVGKLGTVKLLEGLSVKELTELEQAAVWRRYPAETQILDRASSSRDVFFVVEGAVQVVNFSTSGREIAYAKLGPGEFFGELSAVDGQPRSATVVSAQASLLAALAPATFERLLHARPDIAFRVLKRLAAIIRDCDERIMDLATLGAVQRVQLELLRLAKPDPITAGSWLIYPMPTQHDVAARASTTRETVARVLGQLIQNGLIRRKHKTVYLADRAALERMSERVAPERAFTA
ncbi:MAG: Crp/Fnr family transcriptional regulator [Alphaproteobacteria bacterium]|nr:Crp/Fnr family transcriptional regulator [Alphaproteobacteria bacterium]